MDENQNAKTVSLLILTAGALIAYGIYRYNQPSTETSSPTRVARLGVSDLDPEDTVADLEDQAQRFKRIAQHNYDLLSEIRSLAENTDTEDCEDMPGALEEILRAAEDGEEP